MSTSNPHTGAPRRWHDGARPSLFWPILLIGAGVLLLLSNLGYLPWESWNVLWRLWPLALIALGIDLLIGRRSAIGALISGLLILLLVAGALVLVLFAQNIPALGELTRPPDMQVEHIQHPLDHIEEATVEIDWSSLPGELSALTDSPHLIAGQIAHRGNLIFNVTVRGTRADVDLETYAASGGFGPAAWRQQEDYRWDVQLSPRALFDLRLDAGSGRYRFDLTGLQVRTLMLDAGSGPIELILPAGRSLDGRIEGGSGTLTIHLPQSMGARIELESGSGRFHADRRFRLTAGAWDDDGVWTTENFDTAETTVELRIDQGSGDIFIGE